MGASGKNLTYQRMRLFISGKRITKRCEKKKKEAVEMTFIGRIASTGKTTKGAEVKETQTSMLWGVGISVPHIEQTRGEK